jgi:hypothetical protein
VSTSLADVVSACKDAGFNITDAEVVLLTRRLRPAGSLHDPALSGGVGPDPLAGAESDPVAAVEHLFTERTGLASRRFRTYPDVAGLLGQTPEPEPEPEPAPEPTPPSKRTSPFKPDPEEES